jgi:hypothetical protein
MRCLSEVLAVNNDTELRTIQVETLNREFGPAGWHVFLSDEDRFWAVTARVSPAAWRSGTTLDADTAAEMHDLLNGRTRRDDITHLEHAREHWQWRLDTARTAADAATAELNRIDDALAASRLLAAYDAPSGAAA